MTSKNKPTPCVTNKEDLTNGKHLNLAEYMVCLDKLALNLAPLNENKIFNYMALQTNFEQNEVGGFDIGDSYCLYRNNQQERNYTYSYNINRQDEHVGTIHLNSRLPNKKQVKLEIENQVFYHEGTGWYKHYLNLCGLLGLKLNNITEVHLALDAPGMYNWFHDKYYNSTCIERIPNAVEPLPEPLYKPVFTTTIDGHMKTEFLIGDKKAGKVVALYKKHSEIKHSKKNYITDAHINNGLSINEGIDRLEARLVNKWLSKYYIKLDDLNSPTGLERVLATAVKEIGFRDLKAPRIRDRNDNYKFVCYYLINPGMFKAKPLERVMKHKNTKDIRTERAITNTFKANFDEYIRIGRLQGKWHLRYYIDCEENFIGTDRHNRHNGLISNRELSRGKYMGLVKRYVKNYTRDRKELDNAMVGRLKTVEHDLFGNTDAVTIQHGERTVKLVDAFTTFLNPTFYCPTSVL